MKVLGEVKCSRALKPSPIGSQGVFSGIPDVARRARRARGHVIGMTCIVWGSEMYGKSIVAKASEAPKIIMMPTLLVGNTQQFYSVFL